MGIFMVDADTLAVGIRALKAVAAADGRLEARERKLMEVAAAALTQGSLPIDTDAVTPIDPSDAARRVTDPASRERIVQAQLVMALVDGDPDQRELDVIRSFAKAFDVSDPRVENLSHLVHEQHTMLKLDLNRRSEMTQQAITHAYEQQGLRGAWKSMAPLVTKYLGNDEQLAQKYSALGELEPGTLGREYHDHMRERGFPFPGEPKGFPEVFIKHDLCHMVGGYDTDPTGECEVVGFIAGFIQTDPFWYVFMILVHMHLGIETFQDNPLATNAFDIDRVVAAFEKGSRCKADLYDPSFDWWALMDRPMDEIRVELDIV